MKSSQSTANANAAPAADQKQLPAAESKIEAKLDKTLSGHSNIVRALTVLADGRLASGSYDHTIKLWDVRRGQCVRTLKGHSNYVWALTVLADGHLASGSYDGTIKLWDVRNGKCVQTLSGHRYGVCALTMLADGRLASGSMDNTIKLWDVQRNQCVQTLSGHNDTVLALTVLTDGRLASGSQDKTIKLWDVQRNQCVQTLSGHSGVVRALTVLADGRLASGSYDKTIKLWDVQSGNCVKTLNENIYNENIYEVSALTVLADGRLASGLTAITPKATAFGFVRSMVKLWDVGSGECVQPTSGSTAHVEALTVLADGRLVSGSEDKTIRLWDVGTQKILQLQAQAKIEVGQKKTAEADARLQAEKEAREKAEKEKCEMQEKLATQVKELTEMKAQFEQLKIQQQNKPIAGLSVSFEIPYSELQMGEKLGSGGFGVVYKGKWKSQNVAIKELLDEKPSENAVAEFRKEMQVMAQLRSDHVVRLNGCVLGNPKYCIVMEYLPKGSLFSMLRSNQPLNWWTRYNIATHMANGLTYLHAESILHRDLKSLNVLLDEHYRAKLTDFGLSKLKTETKTTTKTPQSVGSEGWMAPELTRPKAVYTPKSDIFSMGITFWEIASRKIPYEDAHSRALIPLWMAQGEREDIPADCPPKFAHLIKWCWDTDPAKRPTAAEAMKYLQDNENDFKPFNTDQNAAAPVNVNASTVANSFTVSVRK